MKKITGLFKDLPSRQYKRGQLILHQHDMPSSVYFVKTGYVKKYHINNDGKESILLVLSQGDIFPMVWSFTEREHNLSFFEAMTDCEVATMPRDQFRKAIARADVSGSFIKLFADRFSDLIQRLQVIEKSQAIDKVKQALNYLADVTGAEAEDGMVRLGLRITHQEIADMVGLTRETVSTQMKALQDDRVIVNHDKYLLVDINRLSQED